MINDVVPVANTAVSRGFPPFHAYLEHPDGRWYAVWMTRTEPRTQRGHPWHVHVDFGRRDRLYPAFAGDWHLAAYGMRNWDYDTLEESAEAFYRERLLPRLEHGYQLMSGHLAQEWDV
jgi:hypothetical protein